MKAVIITGSILVALAVMYGLAFIGIVPTQKWADKSPGLTKPLAALHLAKLKPKPRLAALPPTPLDRQALDAEKQQLDAERAQIAQDKAAQQQIAANTAAPANTPPVPDTGAKLQSIYAVMAPDDIARIFGKLPDPNVVAALMALDEKKAGQILAALPPDRAARISLRMSRPPAGVLPAAAASHPAASL